MPRNPSVEKIYRNVVDLSTSAQKLLIAITLSLPIFALSCPGHFQKVDGVALRTVPMKTCFFPQLLTTCHRKCLQNRFWSFDRAMNLSYEMAPCFVLGKGSLDKAQSLGNSVLADRWRPDFLSLLFTCHICQGKPLLLQNVHLNDKKKRCTCKMSWNFMCETYCAKVTKMCWLSRQCSFSIRPTWGWTFTLSEFTCFLGTRENHIFMLTD